MAGTDFETIRELGAALGASDEAMLKWRQRGRVPYRLHLPMLQLASERGIKLTADDLVLSTTSRSAA